MKTHNDGDTAPSGSIFVFGSNLAGRHGAGAAKHAAQKFGAVYGVGNGMTGNSYAIPTKGRKLEVLSLRDIEGYAIHFVYHTTQHPEAKFYLTRVGCGLAGYQDHQIAPMFLGVGDNVDVPVSWAKYLTLD
jgi:hypothetical protein